MHIVQTRRQEIRKARVPGVFERGLEEQSGGRSSGETKNVSHCRGKPSRRVSYHNLERLIHPSLHLLPLMHPPPPNSLKQHQNIYRQANRMMRIRQAPRWPNRKPPQHEHHRRKKNRHYL